MVGRVEKQVSAFRISNPCVKIKDFAVGEGRMSKQLKPSEKITFVIKLQSHMHRKFVLFH